MIKKVNKEFLKRSIIKALNVTIIYNFMIIIIFKVLSYFYDCELKSEHISIMIINALVMFLMITNSFYTKLKDKRLSLKKNELLSKKLKQLNKYKNNLKVIVNLSSDGIFEWNVKNDKLFLSKRAKRILGYEKDKVIETSREFVQDFSDEDFNKLKNMIEYVRDNATKKNTYTISLDTKKRGKITIKILYKIFRNENDEVVKIYGSISDVTVEKNNQKRIYNLAYFDKLTKLPNRYHFKEKTERLITQNHEFALFLIDIDNFSHINEAFDYEIGDLILKETAKRLLNSDIDFNIIARLGGDEFTAIYLGNHSDSELRDIAEKIKNIFDDPVRINDHFYHIGISIGISQYPMSAIAYSRLMKNADIALKDIKKKSKGNYKIFDKILENNKMRELFIYNNLKSAIPNDEFYLVYQPKIDIKTEEIIGFEALIRWKKNEKLISPSEFIEIAEKNGYIEKITDWVLIKICKDIKRLEDEFDKEYRISLNISYVEFSKYDFVEKFVGILKSENVDSSRIEIEITERTLVDNLEDSAEKLERFKQMGVEISLDDFGTGYSSLSYLQRLPLNYIKLDKSFLNTLEHTKNKEVIKSIIDLAHNINLKVIAEGIEKEENVIFLKESNCDYVQGYYYYKPMKFDEIVKLLRDG